MLREGLKKVKYLKGGEVSDFCCVFKFSIINIKLGWEGGTRLQYPIRLEGGESC